MTKIPTQLREAFQNAFFSFWDALSAEQQAKAMSFMTLGSQNHNYRSMILDGEVVCLVSGMATFNALLDMFALAGITTWVDDPESLEELLPAYEGLNKWLSRFIMKTL